MVINLQIVIPHISMETQNKVVYFSAHFKGKFGILHGNINTSLSKKIHTTCTLRFTTDNWITFHDFECERTWSSEIENHRYSCHLYILKPCVIKLAICYKKFKGKIELETEWDNNYEENYEIKCEQQEMCILDTRVSSKCIVHRNPHDVFIEKIKEEYDGYLVSTDFTNCSYKEVGCKGKEKLLNTADMFLKHHFGKNTSIMVEAIGISWEHSEKLRESNSVRQLPLYCILKNASYTEFEELTSLKSSFISPYGWPFGGFKKNYGNYNTFYDIIKKRNEDVKSRKILIPKLKIFKFEFEKLVNEWFTQDELYYLSSQVGIGVEDFNFINQYDKKLKIDHCFNNNN
jgi:hypothetical protein